jgi:hypothetical protein
MAYRIFGNGYDWTGADGRPEFVSIGDTPPVFQPQNPVDAHVQFAMQTHAGQQPQTISPAIAAMQSAIPGLQQQFNPTAPTGYGTLPNGNAVFGGQEISGIDSEIYAKQLRNQQAQRSMGYLAGENAAGTVDSFFRHPAVAGKTPEEIAAMYDTVFGPGRLQKDLLANQLSQQRAAQDPSGYTPVTYRDVNEYTASQSPGAIKAATERLEGFHKQSGVSALDFLHSIGANNMANLPEVKDRNGMVTKPASQVFADPALQANLRKSLNIMAGQNSFPGPLAGHEAADAADLYRRSLESQAAAAPAAPTSMGVPIDPNISPVHQLGRGIAAAASPAFQRVERSAMGGAEKLVNLPEWLINFFRAQNQQVPLRSLRGTRDAPDFSYWSSME